jgi:hypothetical protein
MPSHKEEETVMRILKSTDLIIAGVAVLFAVATLVGSSYAQIDPETVVGMWLFDEGEGEIAKDSSGNGNNVKLENGTGWAEGKFGQALNFDGQNDLASANVPNAPQGAAVRTIVGWAKSNNTSTHSGIVAYGNPEAVNLVFGFLHYEGVWVSQLWGPEPWDLKTNVRVDQSWHHHAVLYDGENLVHYYDGEEVAKAPRNPATVGTTLIIGAEPDRNDWFTGLVDEVAIFNVVLTESDIKKIMTEGLKTGAAVSSAGKLAAAWGRIKVQN